MSIKDKILLVMSFTLADFETTLSGIAENLRSSLARFSDLLPLSDEDKAKEEQAIAKIVDALRSKRQELEDAIVAVYQGTFTEEELDGVIAFHQSPAGAALREKSPAMMDTIFTTTQAWYGPAIEALNEDLAHLLGSINAGAPVEGQVAEEMDFGESVVGTWEPKDAPVTGEKWDQVAAEKPQIEIDPSRQVKYDEPKSIEDAVEFPPLEGKSGEVKWAEVTLDKLFRAQKIVAEDTAPTDGMGTGMGTRIGDVFVGDHPQRPSGSQRTLTLFFANAALGNEIVWRTCKPGEKIRMEVEFIQDCTFKCKLEGLTVAERG